MNAAHRWAGVRPSESDIARHRESGSWRQATPASDLRKWALQTPRAIAVSAHRADGGFVTLTYAQYAEEVERFAAVLDGLGVRVGDVVAVHLPNWWQVNALMLACAWLGAVFAPVQPSVRRRELELVLRGVAATVCVTADEWDGVAYAAELAALSPRLPALRNRLVLGNSVPDGGLDLTRAAREIRTDGAIPNSSCEDADRVSVVMFTSGTTGAPKAVLHSFNTLHAGHVAPGVGARLCADDVLYTPHPLTHALGQMVCNLIPLFAGAEAVFADVWHPDTAVDLMARRAVTYVAAAPVFIGGLVMAAQSRGGLSSLRRVVGSGATIPADLVDRVRDGLGCTLEAVWGMTEIPGGTSTDAGSDPGDWAAKSVGRPHRGAEVDLAVEGAMSENRPGRLRVRGPALCLATAGRDDTEPPYVLADHDDGWYETGDLALPDGQGGIRLAGRVADRVGGTFMVPVTDVEDALRTHPDIEDAAVIGYGEGNTLVCAVVTVRTPLSLDAVRGYLTEVGMTEWYQPTRLEVVEELPRNPTGKVLKTVLRERLNGVGPDEQTSPPAQRSAAMETASEASAVTEPRAADPCVRERRRRLRS
ncbi:AMP-binding protein [Streptomyces sp. NPDC048409]|uniref:AMP-binding protein n=1 Tax=Streptomyces sp. NPDC048409 TaxID=3154723 RepID=UPI00342D32F3